MNFQQLLSLWPRTTLALGILGVSAICGCARPGDSAEEAVITAELPKAEALEMSRAGLEKELSQPASPLQRWVEAVEESITRGNAAVLLGAIDQQRLLERATTGPGDPELRKAFQDGTRASWKQRSLAADYLGSMFTFLRVHELGERAGLLFRSSSAQESLNYYLFTMVRTPTGLMVDDIFVVGLNEFASDTLRRGYRLITAEEGGRSPAQRQARQYLDHLPTLMKVTTALAQRKHGEVISLATTLPESVRRERSVLLMRLEAAEGVSLQERAKVMAEWQKLHPDAQDLPLKTADWLAADGQFAQARAIIRTLDERLGGDACLKLRAGELSILDRRAADLAARARAAEGEGQSEAGANVGVGEAKGG